MNRNIITISLVLSVVLCGCGGSRPAAGVRPVEEQLALDAMLIEAKMKRETDSREAAEQGYRALLQKEPAYGAALYEMSVVMMTTGRLDSATVYAERAVAACDSNVWYHLQLAQCLSLTGQQERLLREWDCLLRLRPHPMVAEEIRQQKRRHYAIQAEGHMRAGQLKKAKQCYDKALEATPDDPSLHIGLAQYHKALNHQAEAAAELRAGFEGDAFDTRSKLQMLRTFYTPEEFYGSCSQWAFPLAEMVLSQGDGGAETALFHADLLMRQGRYAEALPQFALYLSADSGDYAAWESLLVCLLETKPTDWASVRAYAERALNLFPLLPMPYYALARVCEAEGRTDEAERYDAKVRELKGGDQ